MCISISIISILYDKKSCLIVLLLTKSSLVLRVKSLFFFISGCSSCHVYRKIDLFYLSLRNVFFNRRRTTREPIRRATLSSTLYYYRQYSRNIDIEWSRTSCNSLNLYTLAFHARQKNLPVKVNLSARIKLAKEKKLTYFHFSLARVLTDSTLRKTLRNSVHVNLYN